MTIIAIRVFFVFLSSVVGYYIGSLLGRVSSRHGAWAAQWSGFGGSILIILIEMVMKKILYQEFVGGRIRAHIRVLHGMGPDERYEAHPDEHATILVHSDNPDTHILLSGDGNSDEGKRRVQPYNTVCEICQAG